MFGLLVGLQVSQICVGIITDQFSFAALGAIGIVIAMRGVQLSAKSQVQKDKDRDTYDDRVKAEVEGRTEKLLELVRSYEQAALTDPLTGLLNRRGGEMAILRNLARSRRVSTACSFLLIDLDHFKLINDRYGHEVGDMVLCNVTKTVESNMRIADLAIRWGGEEILVCLPDTDLEGSILVAGKMRSLIEGLSFANGVRVTASIGVAEVMGVEDLHATLARADMNLYIAKARGRNAVFPGSLDEAPKPATDSARPGSPTQ